MPGATKATAGPLFYELPNSEGTEQMKLDVPEKLFLHVCTETVEQERWVSAQGVWPPAVQGETQSSSRIRALKVTLT